MRTPVRPRSFGVLVNLTPLIDVVFNLVIFFLVASHFARSETVEEVDLPRATQSSEQEEPPRRLLITVKPDGTYHTGGRELSLQEVEWALEEGVGDDPAGYAVQIRGDRHAAFGEVEKLMTLCPKYGVTEVGFKVLGEE